MKITKFVLLFATLFVFFIVSASAQYTPDSGSAERKAIVDALRVSVRRELKKPVIFRISALKVQNGWAVISAELLKPDGSDFDWSGTKYERDWRSGDFENGVQALLKKRGKTWQVVEYGLNSTDYWVGYACEKRKCPTGLRQ